MENNESKYPVETILHRLQIHPFILALPVGLLLAALFYPGELGTWYFFIRIFVLLIVVYISFSRSLVYSDSDHRITHSRFYFRKDIINRKSRFIFLSEIESIEVKQPFFGKILDYGTLRIKTKDKTFSFHYITEPAMSKIILDELISTNKNDLNK